MTAITAGEIQHIIRQFDQDVEAIATSYAHQVDKLPPPPLIYHYTNDVGLKGILETAHFWFTNIFHLNDPTELKNGIQPAIKFLEDTCRDDRPRDQAVRKQCCGHVETRNRRCSSLFCLLLQ